MTGPKWNDEAIALAEGLEHMARNVEDGSDQQFLLAVSRFLAASAIASAQDPQP